MSADLDPAVLADDPKQRPRWNSWTVVQPVQFSDEDRAVPRTVRLCCPAARVGDPVQITEGKRRVDGRITAVAHSILHVKP
ncbi:MAG: hypothetical protein A3H28_08905 [Acidobacteria bacterium RIFCSPLOWO2_02_FULL_61_28]|nr:MAG: hypothetical protein A3H28_08905 [Acidobacteria bacterium RIFCSPLOWO2_02_FULL_61_28]